MKTKHRVIIAGHRGYPKRRPENTLPSFEEAIRCGCDMVETDVRSTKDGELVLMHDMNVMRMCHVDKCVQDMTLAELKELYVGDPKYGLRIPTLRELLELCAPHAELLLDIELKSDLGEENARYLVDRVVAICQEFDVCNRVMLNSFDFYVLKYYKNAYGDLFVTHGYYPYTIMGNVGDSNPAQYLDYACFWASGEEAKKSCDYLISQGIKPCTGSNTTKEAFNELSAYGCVMFTENDPCIHLELRKEI